MVYYYEFDPFFFLVCKRIPKEDRMLFSSNAARRFLNDAFSDEEFVSFCFDYFREVEKDFSAGMRKGDKIQRLLYYCSERDGVQALFNALQEKLPDQYLKHFGDQPPPHQFEATLALGDAPSSMEITINTLSASTQRRILSQAEQIEYYRKFARALVIAGLLVIFSMVVPVKYPITLGVRGMIAGGGLFLCSLSVLQHLVIARHKENIDLCKILLEHLDLLKKQPVLDAETRAQIIFWANQAFAGIWKAKPI
jgi:hypothetical protein